jgi:anti-sigma factor RsiW
MTPHPGDLLSAYADGELSATERATIDDHLVTCPS